MTYSEMIEKMNALYAELHPLQEKHISELGEQGTKRMKEILREIMKLEELMTKAWEEA